MGEWVSEWVRLNGLSCTTFLTKLLCSCHQHVTVNVCAPHRHFFSTFVTVAGKRVVKRRTCRTPHEVVTTWLVDGCLSCGWWQRQLSGSGGCGQPERCGRYSTFNIQLRPLSTTILYTLCKMLLLQILVQRNVCVKSSRMHALSKSVTCIILRSCAQTSWFPSAPQDWECINTVEEADTILLEVSLKTPSYNVIHKFKHGISMLFTDWRTRFAMCSLCVSC